MNKYNSSKSVQHLFSENVRRTYKMINYKNYRIKSLWGNKMIIDEDYYNNPDNEGEIFFQIINLSPFPIKIQKGEIIGQGIIKPYLLAEGDAAAGQRTGGLGSTTK